MGMDRNAVSGTSFQANRDRHAEFMAELTRTARNWGWLVKEREGREGPLRPDGRRWRYLAGPLGKEPTEGFETLPALVRWVEERTFVL